MTVREINLKYDMPPAAVALQRMENELAGARRSGQKLFKFVHGYGSSGKGGKIRLELRAYLERQKQRGKIRDYIPGERFSIFDEATRRAFAHCDELRRDRDLEASNNGMTVVIL